MNVRPAAKRKKPYFIQVFLAVDFMVVAVVGTQLFHAFAPHRHEVVLNTVLHSSEEIWREQSLMMSQTTSGMMFLDNLEIGKIAPDFLLSNLGGDERVSLSSRRDSRPVVLIFGSYT